MPVLPAGSPSATEANDTVRLDLTNSARLGRNHDRRRGAGSGVDGTDAQPSAERRGQAPQPRSGAPPAPGLRAALRRRGRLARATRPLRSDTVRQIECRLLQITALDFL